MLNKKDAPETAVRTEQEINRTLECLTDSIDKLFNDIHLLSDNLSDILVEYQTAPAPEAVINPPKCALSARIQDSALRVVEASSIIRNINERLCISASVTTNK
jgi:hypothetical protein